MTAAELDLLKQTYTVYYFRRQLERLLATTNNTNGSVR